MGTIIFDFDSTLINCESLEEILAPSLAADPQMEAEIRKITALGMEGEITFAQSLTRRLRLAAPTLNDVTNFGHSAIELLTEGMAELIAGLIEKGHEVRIISGGLREAIVPVAIHLGIAEEHVHAVRLNWDAQGQFAGINEQDGFSKSKIEGARSWLPQCPQPRVAIGDGITDYHLKSQNLVHHFIAFAEHVQRDAVMATGEPKAFNVQELKVILEQIL